MARIISTDELTPQSIALMRADEAEWVYNGLDCAVTHEVWQTIHPQLDNVSASTYTFSRDLQGPILEMSLRGVRVDEVRRAEVLADFKKKMRRLEEQFIAITRDGIGFPCSWSSPHQLKKLFYEVMGLPPVKKRNKDGTYTPTVNREALEKLALQYFAEPICNHVLALRDLDKKRQFLETGIDPDGRIRTSFNIAGTNTGRLASSESAFGTGTNLQNVDRDLRSVLIPDPGMKFGNLDLEQGDARNVGAICWNTFVHQMGEAYAGAYLDACESGDLHTTNCRLIWPEKPWTGDLKTDKPIAEEIFYRQDSYRQMSKKGGHGTNFYGTPHTMARHLKVLTSIIADFQRRYFAAYPVIGSFEPKKNDPRRQLPNWHNSVAHQLRETGTLTTMFGRRRRFWGRADDDATLREAIAYEPQSMTADEIDTGLIKLWRAHRVQILLQVHDSILFQYPEAEEATIIPWALETLKHYITLEKDRRFVVPTEAKIGWNWGDASEGNPHGLIKWKGGDDRKRPEVRKVFSIHSI